MAAEGWTTSVLPVNKYLLRAHGGPGCAYSKSRHESLLSWSAYCRADFFQKTFSGFSWLSKSMKRFMYPSNTYWTP